MTRPSVPSVVVAAALLALVTALPVSAGEPTTRWVDDDGLAGPVGCNQLTLASTSIQEAVDASSNGDTILVCPGDYVGQVTIDEVNDLTIKAVKPWTAHVVAATDHPNSEDLIHIDGVSGTTIQWLEVLARTAAPCNGVAGLIAVVNGAADTSIRSNHLGVQGTETMGLCGYARGVFVDSSDRALVAFNRVIDFTGLGITLSLSPNSRARGNTIYYNHVTSPAVFGSAFSTGILIEGSTGTRVLDNTVRSPSTAGVTTPRLATGLVASGVATPSVVLRSNRVFYANTGLEAIFLGTSSIINNRIRFSGGIGMSLLSLGGNSTVADNWVRNSGQQGVHVRGTLNLGAQFTDNDFRFNAGLDCDDDTIGSGTGGTANIWTNNLGIDDDPAEICNPASP